MKFGSVLFVLVLIRNMFYLSEATVLFDRSVFLSSTRCDFSLLSLSPSNVPEVPILLV